MPQKSNINEELREKTARLIKLTLKDIATELGDEFDRNFEREAFFSERWARRKFGDDESRGLLSRSGELRRSIKAETTDHSVIFSSDLPYAAIHNEGGAITVTPRMKRYFWYRYLLITGDKRSAPGKANPSGKPQRKKNGKPRNNKKNRALTGEAGFYKAMALKKAGSKIIIPRRRFIGMHPDAERLIKELIAANVQEIFNS
ncbi:phage virion morphogenesis protein [Bacteroides fragilis]